MNFSLVCFLFLAFAVTGVDLIKCHFCMGSRSCVDGECTGSYCIKKEYYKADTQGKNRWVHKACGNMTGVNMECTYKNGNGDSAPIEHMCTCNSEDMCNAAQWNAERNFVPFVLAGVLLVAKLF